MSWETSEFQSSLRRSREHAFLCFFKERNDLLARDAWETLEEIFDRITAFEVINQVLDRDTRASKARCAAHDFGIDFDDGLTHAFELRIKLRACKLTCTRATRVLPKTISFGRTSWVSNVFCIRRNRDGG